MKGLPAHAHVVIWIAAGYYALLALLFSLRRQSGLGLAAASCQGSSCDWTG